MMVGRYASELRVAWFIPALRGLTCPPPSFDGYIGAGFPSPAEEYVARWSDLNEHSTPRPASKFFLYVEGDSMLGAGIHHRDMLIVDRSLSPVAGQVIVARIRGELLVKQLKRTADGLVLGADNGVHPPIAPTDVDVGVWGVVTAIVHKP